MEAKNELQIKLKTLKLGIIRGNWTYKAFHSFYFHGTQLSKLERIKAEGLKPNKLTGECNYPDLAIEAVYLTTDYHEAKCWAVWNRKDRYSSNPEKAFVIWVPKSKIDQTKLEHDRNLETSPAFEFHGIIEPPFGITDVSDFNSDW
jgi:hypothetical protein